MSDLVYRTLKISPKVLDLLLAAAGAANANELVLKVLISCLIMERFDGFLSAISTLVN